MIINKVMKNADFDFDFDEPSFSDSSNIPSAVDEISSV